MAHDPSPQPNRADKDRTATTAQSPEGVLHRGKRLSGYFFWYVLGIGLNLGLPQLVLFPLCMYLMGSESFGKFIYALGIVRIVDIAPTRGLINTLLRNIAGIAEARRELLIRTAFTLASLAVSGMLLVAILACFGAWGLGTTDSQTALWIAIAALAIAAQNMLLVSSTDLLVKRLFAQRSLWMSISGILAFLALPGFFLIGHTGMVLGYSLGAVAGWGSLLVARAKMFLGRPMLDKQMAKQVVKMWIVLSVSALFIGSGRYVHRTILGSFESYDMVSVFFAAAAVLNLLAMPLNHLGVFGLQLLSAHTSTKSLPPWFTKWYLIAAIAGTGCFYGVAVFVAPWLVRLLYPGVGENAFRPIAIMAPWVSISVLQAASRPFVTKFSHRQALMAIGIISIVTHLGAALLLIPRWGLMGAAWSYGIGTGLSSLAWFGFLVAGTFRPGNGTQQAEPVDDIDPG